MNVKPKTPRFVLSIAILCLFTSIFAVAQSKPAYQVGTIMEVRTHHDEGSTSSETNNYDVSIKVGDKIYVVLYTPPSGLKTAKYAPGRDVLVLVGKNTITSNDILGRSFEMPILTEKLVAAKK